MITVIAYCLTLDDINENVNADAKRASVATTEALALQRSGACDLNCHPDGTLNPQPSTNMEHDKLRAYGKAELAQLYSPGASRASALRLLNKYLHAADGLLDALQRTGYTRGSRHFTRYQVRLIFEYLGEP